MGRYQVVTVLSYRTIDPVVIWVEQIQTWVPLGLRQ